jgi:hypothetical protein
MTMMRVALVSLVVGVATGCRAPATEAGYLQHFHATMTWFEAEARRIASEEWDLEGLDRAQIRTRLAEEVHKLADVLEDSARRLDQKRPPERYRTMHERAMELFQEGAKQERHWAELIRAGDRTAKGFGRDAQRQMVDRFRLVVEEVERVEGPNQQLREQLRLLEEQAAEGG